MFPVSYRDLELMLLDRGVYESCETGWRRLVARSDIDLIDIAAPNDVHAEIALAAVAAGKMVMCEKPLGRNAAEAASMAGAVERAQVPNMVWYNYRRVPAVALAKQLIDEGRLGRIYHYRAKFLQDWKAKAWLLSLWASKTCAVSRAKPGMRSCSNRRVVTLLHRSIAVSRWRAARRRRPSRRRNAS
jgi:GFO/IDH/MocA oxidoreductase family protein